MTGTEGNRGWRSAWVCATLALVAGGIVWCVTEPTEPKILLVAVTVAVTVPLAAIIVALPEQDALLSRVCALIGVCWFSYFGGLVLIGLTPLCEDDLAPDPPLADDECKLSGIVPGVAGLATIFIPLTYALCRRAARTREQPTSGGDSAPTPAR